VAGSAAVAGHEAVAERPDLRTATAGRIAMAVAVRVIV
jgi:hypothetical protein